MNERDALILAICRQPTDDTPRLAFADWCDENGDPDRAEYVRKSIELESHTRDAEGGFFDGEMPGECWQCYRARTGGQHTNGPCRCTRAVLGLKARLSELLRKHERAWLPDWWPVEPGKHRGVPNPGPSLTVRRKHGTPKWSPSWRRGFVGRVWLSMPELAVYLPRLFRECPLSQAKSLYRHPASVYDPVNSHIATARCWDRAEIHNHPSMCQIWSDVFDRMRGGIVTRQTASGVPSRREYPDVTPAYADLDDAILATGRELAFAGLPTP